MNLDIRYKDIIAYWSSFALIAISIWVQLLLFDSFCHIERNSLWLTLFYNAIPALLLGGIGMLIPKKGIMIAYAAVVMSVCSVWLIANCMYYKVNGLFVTWQVAQLADNLHGYESSLLACWSWKLASMPLIGLLSIVAICFLPYRFSGKRAAIVWGITLVGYLASVPVKYHNRRNPANRFGIQWFSLINVPENEGDLCSMAYTEHIYMKMHSSLSYLLVFAHDAVWPKAPVKVTDDDYRRMNQLIKETSAEGEPNVAPQGHLLYILVESMDGLIMDATDLNGEPICRNIHRWAATHPAIRCNSVYSQKVYGESGDGQLICCTGLLPINEGLTCNLYGSNVYPNFAHFFENSAIISPSTYMFNRDITTFSYGFNELCEPQKETPWWNDSIVVDRTIDYLQKADGPACVMALTVDTHMPFDRNQAEVELSDTLTEIERRYMRSFRRADDLLGRLLTWADTAACMHDATIVITGDHYVWYDGLNQRPGCCPLIITSPAITEEIWAKEMYQMDIYTTLLDLLGQTNYYWQGFGLSALRADMSMTVEEQERPYSAEEAFYLSNLLIRTNFFADHP